MNTPRSVLSFALLCCATIAQTTQVFPSDYTAVAEGPFNSPNLPLANGTSRTQCLYDSVALPIASGQQITRLGFRQDATQTAMNAGRSLQLEVRMGYSTFTAANVTATFDTNYSAPPVTVFGPALFVLPNLRDTANPLPNGQFFLNLTTPFVYAPAGRNLIVEYRVFGTSGGGTAFNYVLDRADYYSVVTSGPAGCVHSGGGPAVLVTQPTRPGQYFDATVNAAPANTVGVMAISVGSGLVPAYSLTAVFGGISPTCMGQLSPAGLATLGGATSANGYMNHYFLIPNNLAFAGLPISSQGLFLDFFAPGGVVVSNGAEVVTGTNPRTSVVYAQGAPTGSLTGSVAYNYCPVAFFTHQ